MRTFAASTDAYQLVIFSFLNLTFGGLKKHTLFVRTVTTANDNHTKT